MTLISTRRLRTALATLALSLVGIGAQAAVPTVSLLRAPDAGLQPQAVVDTNGTLHLIYFKGEAAHGDIFYVHKPVGGSAPFSSPLRVNRRPHSATAIGTIRGAQLAVGRGGRVYVEWNGSDQSQKGVGGWPLLFTRLNDAGTGFEPERDLITATEAGGLDGGGSLAADERGNVYVTWHTTAEGRDEARDAVYLSRSTDDGRTFGPDRRINPAPTGACGCCSMRAFVDSKNDLYILYRTAQQNVHRDSTLLVSRDAGQTFRSSTVQPWQIDACPMSMFSLAESRHGVFGAWETQGQVYFASLQTAPPVSPIPVPGVGQRKYPTIVAGSTGRTLLVWSDGSGWMRGGSLAWQVFDSAGKPTSAQGMVKDGVPVWSLPSAVARPDGNFLILY